MAGGQELTDQEIINLLKININGTIQRCFAGLIHIWNHGKGVWHFIEMVYWLDLRVAFDPLSLLE